MSHDLVIVNGMVVDGTGSPPFPADVAIDGDRISDIGRIGAARARRVIDADGLLVSPGFVDMHAHSDLALLRDPGAEAKIMQGVVTEVIGQDGLSYAPVDASTGPSIRAQIAGWNGAFQPSYGEWSSVAEYLDRFDRRTAVNVAFLVPHGNVRMLAVGDTDRPATADELARMRALVRDAMRAGAVGLSTGLSYTPAVFADTDELVALCEEVAAQGGFFAPHTRSYGRGVMEAYAEMVDVARRSGVALHLTHCQASFPGNERIGAELVDYLTSVAAEGLDLTADSYCYVAGSTYLAAFLPGWAWENGAAGVVEHLRDDSAAARIGHELEVGTSGFHGAAMDWSKIQVGSVGSAANASSAGHRISDLAAARGTTPFEEARRLLIEEDLDVNVLTFVGHEENIRAIMQLPNHMGGSDGIMVGDRPHPRAWGTFARYLAHYARDESMFGWGEIVRKLASLPNRRLGQLDRGILRPGMAADIVGFDPVSVCDTASYEEPKRFPKGIPYVLVNGVVVKDDGAHTGATPGRVLRNRADR